MKTFNLNFRLKTKIRNVLILILSIISIISCSSSKKLKETEQRKEDIKIEFQHKLDSLTEIWSKIVQKKMSRKDTSILKTNFEIMFSKKDSGVVNFETPQGKFKAEKKGNGNLRILGQVKNSQIKENQENLSAKKEAKRTKLNNQINAKVQTNRSQKKATHEVEKHGNWFVRLWWLWLIIIVGAWLSWKIFKPKII